MLMSKFYDREKLKKIDYWGIALSFAATLLLLVSCTHGRDADN
jgi:hypothetical protein